MKQTEEFLEKTKSSIEDEEEEHQRWVERLNLCGM